MNWEDAIVVLGCGMPPDPSGRSFEEIVERLERWKADVMEPAHRAAILVAHPDRPGGSLERAQKINDARDVLRGLHVARPQPRRQPQPEVVIIINGGSFGFADAATGTSTTWGSAGGWRRVFV